MQVDETPAWGKVQKGIVWGGGGCEGGGLTAPEDRAEKWWCVVGLGQGRVEDEEKRGREE